MPPPTCTNLNAPGLFTVRPASHADVPDLARLFMIRFPWLNRRPDPLGDTERDLHQRLDDPRSITLIAHTAGQLAVVLRGQRQEDETFRIDALCGNDALPQARLAMLAVNTLRTMLPPALAFARESGASALVFDTHLDQLATVLRKASVSFALPLSYAGSDGTSHRFMLLHHAPPVRDSSSAPSSP